MAQLDVIGFNVVKKLIYAIETRGTALVYFHSEIEVRWWPVHKSMVFCNRYWWTGAIQDRRCQLQSAETTQPGHGWESALRCWWSFCCNESEMGGGGGGGGVCAIFCIWVRDWLATPLQVRIYLWQLSNSTQCIYVASDWRCCSPAWPLLNEKLTG